MFDRLTFYSDTSYFRPMRICLIVYFSAMAVPMLIRYVGLAIAAGVMMAFEVGPTASIVLEFLANILAMSAWTVMIVGTFLMRRTTKLYAIGWLCYAVQVLLSCLLLPTVTDIYGAPDFPVYLLLMYVLLTLCAAAMGVMTLIGRGNKWIMLGAAALGLVLFIATLFAGQGCFVGTMGAVVPLIWGTGTVFDKMNLIFVLISNVALFASAVLVALSHETTYY